MPFLPPEYQSTLASIFNVLLYYSKDRERYGNYAIFKKLIDELKIFENEGIEIDAPTPLGKIKIYFLLGLIIGDNLGLHQMLGFPECFEANYSCRFCRMNRFETSVATE